MPMPALPCLGIYEKALPASMSWRERLLAAHKAGYDYVEMSIDETDTRLARLQWTGGERRELRDIINDTRMPIRSICLSGHRRFPFGSEDPSVRGRAHDIMARAVDFAADMGIRTIQLAGYDVYYEPSTADSLKRFEEGLTWAAGIAARSQVMLGMEIMDTELMSSITRWLAYAEKIRSPWFQVYPDIGNLSAWNNDVSAELIKGDGRITAIHLKDTKKVAPGFPGQFRDLLFGEGSVDFVAAFRTLKAMDYRGAFLVEMWTDKAEDPVFEITRARQWIIARMQEGGLIGPQNP